MTCQPTSCLSVLESMGITTISHVLSCDARVFNQPVGDWDASKVTETRGLFEGVGSFDQDPTRWDMRSVRDAGWMFRFAHAMQRNNKPAAVRDDVYHASLVMRERWRRGRESSSVGWCD